MTDEDNLPESFFASHYFAREWEANKMGSNERAYEA
jgi:hypothetical protein